MCKKMNDRLVFMVCEVVWLVMCGECYLLIGNVMFFYVVLVCFFYDNMYYVLIMGGNVFYEKCKSYFVMCLVLLFVIEGIMCC